MRPTLQPSPMPSMHSRCAPKLPGFLLPRRMRPCLVQTRSSCIATNAHTNIIAACWMIGPGSLVGFLVQVQYALDQLQAMQKRTTLTVAHRLTTIRNSNKIAVLSDGGVQELGTHEHLLTKRGLYSK